MDNLSGNPQNNDSADDVLAAGTNASGTQGEQTDASHPNSGSNRTNYKQRIARWFRYKFRGHRPLEWLTFFFEVLTFFALCIYSYFSWGQWQAMREQKGVMQGQLDQMKGGSAQTDRLITETHTLADNAGKQVDKMTESLSKTDALIRSSTEQVKATRDLAIQAQRSVDLAQSQQPQPWLGIDEGGFALDAPHYGWNPQSPINPMIEFTAHYVVKNYGPVPALHEKDTLTVRPIVFPAGDVFYFGFRPEGSEGTIADPHQMPTCNMREIPSGNSVITTFPGAQRPAGIGANTLSDPENYKAIGMLWVALCIAYQAPNGQWHHSGYFYSSIYKQDAKPITFPEHPGWSYYPLALGLLATSAN